MNINILKFSFIVAFLAFILGPLIAAVGFDATQWQFQKKIIPPANLIRDSFIDLSFDSEIVANARPDFSDLRIIRDDGLEVSYASDKINIPIRLINQEYVGNEASDYCRGLGASSNNFFPL